MPLCSSANQKICTHTQSSFRVHLPCTTTPGTFAIISCLNRSASFTGSFTCTAYPLPNRFFSRWRLPRQTNWPNFMIPISASNERQKENYQYWLSSSILTCAQCFAFFHTKHSLYLSIHPSLNVILPVTGHHNRHSGVSRCSNHFPQLSLRTCIKTLHNMHKWVILPTLLDRSFSLWSARPRTPTLDWPWMPVLHLSCACFHHCRQTHPQWFQRWSRREWARSTWACRCCVCGRLPVQTNRSCREWADRWLTTSVLSV